MSLYIDSKYLNLLSGRLKKFKRTKDAVWNFRCPLCGDSKKNQNKARGYIYAAENSLYYKCHNCNIGRNFCNFIKEIDPNLAREYIKEKYFDDNKTVFKTKKQSEKIESTSQPLFLRKVKNADSIDSLPNKHYARQYISDRKIPKRFWKELYFTKDFKSFISQYSEESSAAIPEDNCRIIIPFYNNNKELIAVQGRSMFSFLRYITIKFTKDSKIWGLDKIDSNKKVFILEGPFDAMFVDNAIAMAGADNKYLLSANNKNNYVFVFDNEPFSREICQRMHDVVDLGFSLVVWNRGIKEKDVNDMIQSGVLNEKTIMIELNNMVYRGIRAKLEIIEWRKR